MGRSRQSQFEHEMDEMDARRGNLWASAPPFFFVYISFGEARSLEAPRHAALNPNASGRVQGVMYPEKQSTSNNFAFLGGVNHCSLHCRLAKFRGLMRRGKYGAVIG